MSTTVRDVQNEIALATQPPLERLGRAIAQLHDLGLHDYSLVVSTLRTKIERAANEAIEALEES